MNTMLAAVAVATATLAGAASAMAGGLPRTPLGVMGTSRQFLAFQRPGTPMISERAIANAGGQNYPNFTTPRHASRFAEVRFTTTIGG